MLSWQQQFDLSVATILNSWAEPPGWFHLLTIFFARYAILLFAASILYLFWKRKIRAVFVAIMAIALAFFVEYAISIVWTRPRPFLIHSSIMQLDPVSGAISSFPSSHAVITFATATALLLYGHRRLGSLLLVVAICVAIARVAAGVHYPSDVIAGALLGILTGIVSRHIVESALDHHHEAEAE